LIVVVLGDVGVLEGAHGGAGPLRGMGRMASCEGSSGSTPSRIAKIRRSSRAGEPYSEAASLFRRCDATHSVSSCLALLLATEKQGQRNGSWVSDVREGGKPPAVDDGVSVMVLTRRSRGSWSR
jgi:hypothetical protein